jgi:hypothetical protein
LRVTITEREMPMTDAETRVSHIENPEAILAQWQNRLINLVHEVKGWVERNGWRTRTIEKPINDGKLGRYTVPVLLMEKDTVEVALNPVSPLVPGAEGAVDLYLVPAYDDIASLYFEGGQWVIYYASPDASMELRSPIRAEAIPFSEATFVQILNLISLHAA